ncbi:hypothetical protein PCANC_00472 [Puccinia coronata f. sp. avenae]|uniref:Secreted protein n=1 Tax=Puccinia coronata f. sp. avenae TaxID=200324 RepID=A0A2N5T6N4_9BASI|nr:hypothetical protein PCANC_05478 [Puccinia coronata f. sp. avenae]PLW23596.1 hypothetical protein PCASD_11373 [Puccinia coronata f. sp. avenae]PLW39009.1 hypothetical protein PCASD_08424 [Puccinia coronata f. sp. avenae]PLW58462.1 hypothetical protein PCANC_00472 [Puccinia coronata f. sp. avenae]
MVNFALAAAFLAVVLPPVMPTTHTTCYNYFLKKDGCVNSANDPKIRCEPKPYSGGVPAFSMSGGSKTKRGVETTISLIKRYDTTQPSFFLASGTGNCGYYDTNTQDGACLWSGPEQNNPTVESAGWLNSQKTSNCHKELYIGLKEEGAAGTKYAPVLDGCSFGTTDPAVGCFQIGVTLQLFKKFNPTPAENMAGKITRTIVWDFNSFKGEHTKNGPV